MSFFGTTELIVLAAVERGEFTIDTSLFNRIRWRGKEAEYDTFATVNNLSCDGYVTYDDEVDNSVVELTGKGREALS